MRMRKLLTILWGAGALAYLISYEYLLILIYLHGIVRCYEPNSAVLISEILMGMLTIILTIYYVKRELDKIRG